MELIVARRSRANRKGRVRLAEAEASRLDGLLCNANVVTKDGLEGHVTRITCGGIQVAFPMSHTIRPYPIYDSIVTGELRFKEIDSQKEMLHSLYEAAGSAGIQTLPEWEQVSKESDKPFVSQVDVPGNIRLALFLKNVDVDRYLLHMKRVGLTGFEESINEGVNQSPFLTLRETAYYLGCSLELLLSSFEEYLRHMLGECTAPAGWSWSEPVRDRTTEGNPHLRVRCKNSDERRSFVVHAVYDVETYRSCKAMQVVTVDKRPETNEYHTMKFAVLDPKPETVSAFVAAYESAGGTLARPAATSSPPMPVTKPVPTAASAGLAAGATLTSVRPAVAAPLKQRPDAPGGRQAKPIHVNEFLVRRSYGSHRANGHSLEPIRATVSILPKWGGDPIPVEFDAYWCPKCRKYFMGDGTYLKLKRRGYICCKVVEEKDLGTRRTGDGLYGNLASESILHMYGYTVNQQDNLSEAERQTIISFVIENGIQSAQDVAHLLEWLISQREANPRMAVAVGRWRADLRFAKRYHKPTRKVRVDSIYAKI